MILADGDDLIFGRTLNEEGKDHFGKACAGPKKVLCIMNRSDKMKMLVRLDEASNVVSTEHIHDIFTGDGETKCVLSSEQQGRVEVRPLSAIVYVQV